MRPRFRRLGRRGNTAIEFAVVGLVFLGLLIGALELAFLFYAQIALDYATNEAARTMQVGTNRSAATSNTTFETIAFCPQLGTMLNCNNVTINLQVVTNYQNIGTGTTTYNAGNTGSLMLLQVYYTTGLPSWPLNVSTIMSAAAYLNE
jgi:Flp pilus assembly protein TadG